MAKHGGAKPEETINLFDQGMRPSLELTREESMERGWIHEDTSRTRLVQYKGELIEIDWRMRVSSDGKRIVWCPGHNPTTKKKLQAASRKANERVRNGELKRSRRGKKNISSVLRKFMQAPVSKQELGKLPKNVQKALEDYMGGELTRGDVAAFVLMGKAMEGDIMAFKEIADRTEGKAIQRTENKNLNMNYTDFLKGLAGFDEEDEDEDPYIDV